jgi:hypothetical protein
VAVRDRQARFTALLHHVSLDRLREAYRVINPKAAPGVDGVRWEAYGQDRQENLRDLHHRVQAGRYRASASRRVYIPEGGRAAAAARHRHAGRQDSSAGVSSRCGAPSTKQTSGGSAVSSGHGDKRRACHDFRVSHG